MATIGVVSKTPSLGVCPANATVALRTCPVVIDSVVAVGKKGGVVTDSSETRLGRVRSTIRAKGLLAIWTIAQTNPPPISRVVNLMTRCMYLGDGYGSEGVVAQKLLMGVKVSG